MIQWEPTGADLRKRDSENLSRATARLAELKSSRPDHLSRKEQIRLIYWELRVFVLKFTFRMNYGNRIAPS